MNVDAVRLLAGAAGERVVSESETPATPPATPEYDPAANSSTWAFGLLDAGTRIAVGLVYDTPPGPTTREQQDRAYMPQDVWTALESTGRVDVWGVYVAQGGHLTRAREVGHRGGVYVEVRLSGPGPFDPAGVADEVLSQLETR